MKRREFIQTTAGAGSPECLSLKSKAAFGYQANSAVRHGAAGMRESRHACGHFVLAEHCGAGGGARRSVSRISSTRAARTSTGECGAGPTPRSRRRLLFHGPHAFEQLAASPDVDLIQISTPPFFHVQHLEAAVAAGKHVYCEKPVGIDVEQANQALEIGKRVGPTQSVDVGFQCRSAPPIAAIAEQIKGGALGKIASISAYYYAPASTEKSLSRRMGRTSTGCATGCGTARCRATSWSSRTSTSSTCATGFWARGR